ncbi:protein translocase subunit yajC [Mucilaginibacter gossypiicola]|uniref:Sec translocon accessory complex subunit YajC n=1 Tax=Mucilaginibacter gossypiicola TaxID=551995 RepID=A0A1H8LB19_9SPHI|nr:preprotein translocase subunit YajC [Mucilaginibacter gossypiicola]SEO02345.1 protein translocase subunit yajC [Mucilaginibacter gossypiicola]
MIATILLQASAGGGLGSYGSLVPMVLIIVVFYFFMIRPQVKKQKDQKKYVEELKKGDRVITTAGIHGRIVDLNDTTFLVEVENGKIRFDKSAISLDASKALNTPATPVVEKKA